MIRLNAVVFSLLVLLACASVASAETEVARAAREIDVSGALARDRTVLTFKNPPSTITVAYLSSHAALVTAKQDGQEVSVSASPVLKEVNGRTFSLFDIQIKSADKVEIEVNAILTHAFLPRPEKISQGQPNAFVIEENLFISSPYKVKSQTTKVVGMKTVVSSTDDDTLKADDERVEYGPFKAAEPFQYSELKSHFLTPVNPVRISKLVREVEVSHWGNVAVEETFEIYNDGAALDAGFSRVDFMYGKSGNSFNLVTQFLPREAEDIYYRDVIGNISSSRVFPDSSRNRIKFEIQPRFVMFGGWKIEFYTGYNLPASHYLGLDQNGNYLLTTDFSVTFLEDITIDDFELRVILPEGSTVVDKHIPFPVTELPTGTRLTYLDTSGRPVLVFKKTNLVNQHNVPFEIRYSFPSTLIFKEPLLLIGAYFAFFLAAIVYFRADFSLHPGN